MTAMADKPAQRASIKEKLEVFKVKVAGLKSRRITRKGDDAGEKFIKNLLQKR